MASQQQDDRMRSEADAALREHSHLNCDGFESSKVFALTSAILASPKPGGMTRSRLIRNINAIFLFIVHPTTPLDASNPRTKPTKSSSGGALRPALWHVDMRRSGQIGKGQPPTTLLGRKRRADIVVECRDRDLVDLATGKLHPAKLYNGGRVSSI
ncbi:potential peroxisomal lipid carrier [Ceraceosorus bombacis]|uniref:Potential peroxisomal lipid carrier n=1 Tax=Ceraceosorus bombacis TaxID=401625 RepID=A0A0P1BJJ2_9BASI|nr:potential peroxisomal lipid carrier [Ceraceosorus bombacis]